MDLRRRARRAAGGLAALLLLAAPVAALPAPAPYELPSARVRARLERDGAVTVSEALTVRAPTVPPRLWRDVPLAPDQAVSRVAVREGARAYQPASHPGTAGTFHVARTGTGTRVTWHPPPGPGERTFTLSYRLERVAVAYQDVVDVRLPVWTDQWPVPLGTLQVSVRLPAGHGQVRAWAHAVGAPPAVRVTGNQVELTARAVPAQEEVWLRVTAPRSLVRAPAAARAVPAPGLGRILADERLGLPPPPLPAAEEPEGAAAAPLLAGLATLALGALLAAAAARHRREQDPTGLDTPLRWPRPRR